MMENNNEIPNPVEEATSSTTPVDPKVRGNLTPQKLKLMQSLRQAGRDVVLEVGMLEVRKSRLLTSLADIESRGEALMKEEAKRVGVPDGTPFQVTPDGAILVNPQVES